MRLICQWGFGSLGLERVDLLAATANVASQQVDPQPFGNLSVHHADECGSSQIAAELA